MSESELKKVYQAFTDCWRFFKKYSEMSDDDESWEGVVSESGQIAKKYGNDKFVRDLLSASIAELERRVKKLREEQKSAESQ